EDPCIAPYRLAVRVSLGLAGLYNPAGGGTDVGAPISRGVLPRSGAGRHQPCSAPQRDRYLAPRIPSAHWAFLPGDRSDAFIRARAGGVPPHRPAARPPAVGPAPPRARRRAAAPWARP